MPTALELVHSAAALAGRMEQRVTTAVGTTQTLVCSAFVNSVLSPSEFANWAILIESGCCAGEMGMVTNAGLTVASGTLSTATTFSAAIASGVAFSMYSRDRLPPLDLAGKDGWLRIANGGLERTYFEDTISFVGVTDAIHYTVDTTTYPWFTDDTRIIEVQMPTNAADDAPTVMARERWSWVADGEIRRLRFTGKPFKTGETFTVKVNRPGNSRLKLNASCRAVLSTTTVGSVVVTAGGYYSATPTVSFSGGGGSGAAGTAVLTNGALTSVTVTNAGTGYATTPTVTITRTGSDTGWQDQATQTAGLVTMTDECVPDVRIVRPMMMALGFRQLAEVGAPGQTAEEWLGKAAEWEAKAVGIKTRRTPRDPNQGVIRLRSAAVSAVPYGYR